MSGKSVRYTIIALTESDVQSALTKLNQHGAEHAADWLAKCHNDFYGNRPEKWRPFGPDRKSLSDLIDLVDEGKCFTFQFAIMDQIAQGQDVYQDFAESGIQVFFIDPCATLLDKYYDLAKALDLYLAEGIMRRCYLMIDIDIPIEARKELEKHSEQTWRAVWKRRGFQPCKNEIIRELATVSKLLPELKELAQWQIDYETFRKVDQILSRHSRGETGSTSFW